MASLRCFLAIPFQRFRPLRDCLAETDNFSGSLVSINVLCPSSVSVDVFSIVALGNYVNLGSALDLGADPAGEDEKAALVLEEVHAVAAKIFRMVLAMTAQAAGSRGDEVADLRHHGRS
jgi:hypothetical protein